MADTLQLELVSPEKLILSVNVEMVVVPGSEGDFGVLPLHVPLLSSLRSGLVDVYKEGRQLADSYFVAGGFAEVTRESCTVLVSEAVPVDHLTPAYVKGYQDTAERLLDHASTNEEHIEAQNAVKLADQIASIAAKNRA